MTKRKDALVLDKEGGIDVASLHAAVAHLVTDVADTVVLPRFRNLLAHEISEKSRGETVTIADEESELMLTEGLARLDPDARVIGEEACGRDARLLANLDRGRIWIVDPIDGTTNFSKGNRPFGIIIALVEDGITIGGWLYDPVSRRLCHAVAGAGAFIDGRPFRTCPSGRDRPIAALATQFMAPGVGERVRRQAEPAFDVVPIPRCAAEHYPRVALGENDVALFQRTLPWDHAAGALFLQEAGGVVTRWNGSPYAIADGGTGLLIATCVQSWERAFSVLCPDAPDFAQSDG